VQGGELALRLEQVSVAGEPVEQETTRHHCILGGPRVVEALSRWWRR